MGLSKGPEKKGSIVSATRSEKDQANSHKKDASTAGKKTAAVESSGQEVNDIHVVGKSSKSEIDEIFGNKKRKVVVPEQDLHAELAAQTKNKKKKKKGGEAEKSVSISSNRPSSNSVTPSSAKARKKTIDGFTIYSEDEIGFGKKNAGGTSLCPFDCECCF
ncbi:hypothetical protein MPTK1_2g17640 [Marchantia polymorpha subsp. ruderalis]|uniref:DUF1764 domain-containing protein n=1 Tax=Marchantia polymorpha TaxID=3197 RepID=A0A2R6WG84_MARPO|nr:hypothetical protein MARPO_0094s0032 [Marchantia polymorpha]BBN02730.1 hypothetical protein Mp_2g17640 [Marchantia polymorpha subsp. ruderalis]PTQ32856.1 hypothetical protein MARPO_0094s0032 [Marchantia polymorpha]PTQ32857.1 hypothetical protein MARPO_0094s0032 [Marchantia polymorpha]BBN02731.1 hypothetical protein Mp_2g17640 [Marchantia polymorpha subsp. ruderalis]|eukprot:PTQ32855.1 hypothetical protein MARPO_0094s0032 [Marchantia polymorpha]